MGRVYNALVRAERFSDPDRPIGSPESNGAAAGRGAGAIPGVSRKSSPAVVTSVFEDELDLTVDPTASTYVESPVVMQSREVRTPVTVPAVVPRPGVVLARPTVSTVPAPSATPVVFEEPAAILSILDLAIDPHVAALSGNSLATERYRTLALKLLNLADRRKMKTLMITSAQSGDGKTTVATGVAWSLAKGADRRVLLIDASPSSSSVARMLGIDPKRGWLDLLDGSSELKQTLTRLDPNGLYVLTAGGTSSRHGRDFWSSRFEDLITEVSPRFDLVIVDAGSIPESTETQRLASVLDGVVIVARANHTHHARVTEARKLVPKERRLGVVLNESGADAEVVHRESKGRGLVGRLFGRRQ